MEEHRRVEEARLAEEAALAVAEKEKARSKAALEHAEAAQRIGELEAQKRRSAKIKVFKEVEVLSCIRHPNMVLLLGAYLAYGCLVYDKISDVGLARLVPPSVADNVTQYRMTSTARTFCYIDPEYQQTGMLGIKSDIYSLGIMFLQLITAKPPMGLTHQVEKAIERGSFAEMLDQTVPDWLVEEALSFAKMALKCAELRRKDWQGCHART
ncbi:hypothetical protein RJ640_015855 [Escallonia rubra]|uniref:RING-type E3 ubiquitin transferase n=1 Tax=Escallonia rubra TaxID=112253 RepID=A0AA88UHZ0_9ASTE|nr:hypothetical protein RJ640_015855 [Escallonia rubra]